jgi:molybdopterin-synthase adenylyltransferase
MSAVDFSVALTSDVAKSLQKHLLKYVSLGQRQEELCFALWNQSPGKNRKSALIFEVILPEPGERELHGNVSFLPRYLERALSIALEKRSGLAFLHNHFTPGWQGMSRDDVIAEERLAPRVHAVTNQPLLGLTMGTDGALSARFWHRIGRNQYQRDWCGSVRVIGEDFAVTNMNELAPEPAFRESLKRTVSAWGKDKQKAIARLHCGVIGAGSVGALIGESLARIGIETTTLVDFDVVKKHNLDRLLHATNDDIGRLKVDVAAEALKRHATAEKFEVRTFPCSLASDEGLKAAMDCDILFSCVDRPWPRQILNKLAYGHLIPVIDGGIRVSVTASQKMRGADWRAHLAMPGRPCLECLKQYDPADVSLEQQGLLDDPEYIKGLSADHFIHRNENVFPFAMNAAGLMMLQFLSLVVKPSGLSNPGAQRFHFAIGSMDKEPMNNCGPHCLIKDHIGTADLFPYPLI